MFCLYGHTLHGTVYPRLRRRSSFVKPMSEEVVDKLGNSLENEIDGDSQSQSAMDRGEHSIANINDLPLELLVQIFSCLDVNYVLKLRMVCKRWNHAIMDKECWERIFARRFRVKGAFALVTAAGSPVEEYFKRIETMRKWRSSNLIRSYYKLNVFGNPRFVDKVLIDFPGNKYLALVEGNVNRCKMTDGKHNITLPYSDYYEHFDLSWRYFCFTPDSSRVYVRDMKLERRTATELIPHDSVQGTITCLVLNDSNYSAEKCPWFIAVGTDLGELSFWDNEGKQVAHYSMNGRKIRKLAYTKNSQYLIFASDRSVCLYDVVNHKLLQEVEVDIDLVPVEPAYLSEDPWESSVGFDVDWDGRNVILWRHKSIRVVDFLDIENPHIRLRDINTGSGASEGRILLGKMQTHIQTGIPYNKHRLGGDGLLYANVLSDQSVVVWNVRDYKNTNIEWQCVIKENQRMWNFHYASTARLIFGIALNSLVVVLGISNGNTLAYSALTGKYLGQCTSNPPKKFFTPTLDVFPDIQLNSLQTDTEGVVTFGGYVEYFRFDNPINSNKSNGSNGRKQAKLLRSTRPEGSNSHLNARNVREQLQDFEEYQEERLLDSERVHAYNGDFLDGENEVSLALAISESARHQPDVDLDLALALSMQEEHSNTTDDSVPDGHGNERTGNRNANANEDEDEEEQLRRILELSLTEQ